MTTQIISILNFKGGCTKTSTACGLGAALAHQGQEVLIVDLDPQSHVAVHLGIKEEDIKFSIDDALIKGGAHISNVIVETEDKGLHVAPSRRYLLNARHMMEKRMRRDALLDRVLGPVKDKYNYIIIDTPPDEGILSVNAMYACNYIIIPTPLDAFSLVGINALADAFLSMKEAYEDRELDILGVLINRYDERLKVQNEWNIQELTREFTGMLFNTRIRADERIRQAQTKGVSIYQNDPRSKGAEDFKRLALEVMERTGQDGA